MAKKPSKRLPKPKPRRSVSRATRAKISKGIKSYWQRVRETQAKYKLKSLSSAKEFYKAREKIAADRFERIAIDSASDRPKHISKTVLKKFGKVLERGKDKGRIVMYYDRLKKEPIKAKRAIKMRRENTVSRVALRAQELTKTAQGRFAEKYWPKYALKRGYLTEFEAKRFAVKLLRLRKTDDSVRVGMKNIYGYS